MAATERRTTLVVLSDADVVARGVLARWSDLPPTGEHVDGAAVHTLGGDLLVVRRPGPHLHDDELDRRLPPALRERRPTLVFPSIHRSESGQRCFTVHPIGNPGPRAELGGRPRKLVPTDPWAMAGLLRELDQRAPSVGLHATYEATHHGPWLGLPALFAEVAVTDGQAPTDTELGVLAAALREFHPDPADRTALAVGGGHYAPRFTDLARSRHWAFGHIVSRHALTELEPTTAREALEATPSAAGVLFARAQDRDHPAFAGIGAEVRETDAPLRGRTPSTATSTSPRTSGT